MTSKPNPRRRGRGSDNHSLLARAEALTHVGTFELELPSQGADHWSDGALRILGRPAGERPLSSDDFVEHAVHPEDRSLVRGALEASRRDAAPLDIEFRVIT